MKPKEFAKLVERDRYCLHCGETEAVSPNHRANRGMGGFKGAEKPSNYVLLCSEMNGRIEADSKAAEIARMFGWKVSKYENPQEVPVYDTLTGTYFFLLDDWTRYPSFEERD